MVGMGVCELVLLDTHVLYLGDGSTSGTLLLEALNSFAAAAAAARICVAELLVVRLPSRKRSALSVGSGSDAVLRL